MRQGTSQLFESPLSEFMITSGLGCRQVLDDQLSLSPHVTVTVVFTEAEMSLLCADRSQFSVAMGAPLY